MAAGVVWPVQAAGRGGAVRGATLAAGPHRSYCPTAALRLSSAAAGQPARRVTAAPTQNHKDKTARRFEFLQFVRQYKSARIVQFSSLPLNRGGDALQRGGQPDTHPEPGEEGGGEAGHDGLHSSHQPGGPGILPPALHATTAPGPG